MVMTLKPRFDLCNSEISYFCFLYKKTRDKRSLFSYTRRHAIVWISNVFSKAPVKCWQVQITEEYLPTSQKSLQVSQLSAIFTKLCTR